MPAGKHHAKATYGNELNVKIRCTSKSMLTDYTILLFMMIIDECQSQSAKVLHLP